MVAGGVLVLAAYFAVVQPALPAAWRTPADFSSQAANGVALDDTWDIKSRWFIVQSRIRLDRAALNAESLIERTPVVSVGGGTRVIWTRQN